MPAGKPHNIMNFAEATDVIIALCKDQTLTFTQRAASIARSLNVCTEDDILEHLDSAGVIPERFQHDSTEEKLFAKYCDALLANGLSAIGLPAETILERADAADVIGTLDGYKVVADAKAFRLSRTAKNQKDFKVEALDKWRKGADYASLVAPIYQFPTASSQIYLQERVYNFTLLSYTHLAYLVRHKPTPSSIRPLWEVAKTIPATKNARAYWKAVEAVVLRLTRTSAADWNRAVEEQSARLPKQAAEQIAFWEQEKARISGLPHDVAKRELIQALKIDNKIAVIRKNFQELVETKETFES